MLWEFNNNLTPMKKLLFTICSIYRGIDLDSGRLGSMSRKGPDFWQTRELFGRRALWKGALQWILLMFVCLLWILNVQQNFYYSSYSSCNSFNTVQLLPHNFSSLETSETSQNGAVMYFWLLRDTCPWCDSEVDYQFLHVDLEISGKDVITTQAKRIANPSV